MRIAEAIKMLRDEQRAGVKSVILAYWTAEFLGRADNEEFLADSEYVERHMDWSSDNEAIEEILAQENN